MTKSKLSAAMGLTLLVMPGSGHFLYRRWLRGALWATAFTLPALGLLVFFAIHLGQLWNSLASPSGDVAGLGEFLVRMLAGFAVCALIYAGAAWDTYRLGLREERLELATSAQELA